MGHHGAELENSKHSYDQEKTEGLIRSVIVEQKTKASRASLPDLAPVEPDHSTQARGQTASKAPRRRSKKNIRDLKGMLLAYRPTRAHILWALVLLVVVWRPWLIPGALFVSFWVGLIAYLTVGSDRFLEWTSSAWYQLMNKNPALAEKLRSRADAFALRFDAFLDRLPESWAEKLALPDLSTQRAEQEALNDRPDPFDRLKTPEVYRG